jgi:tetratricopeptide (TPR) repeat protein
MNLGGWQRMSRPRLFLSAVSEELTSARQSVAATVRTLGFDAISQDDFSTGYGELRNWLSEQIDSCAGLIQLVGHGYGAEPSNVDPDYGRVSYTQFEFLYAGHQGKKTWVIVIGDGCRRDKPIDQLDLPRETVPADAAAYQAERRKLQKDYIDRLIRENHLRHTANNDTELQNIVLRLRDYLQELRKKWEEWLKKDEAFKARTTSQLDELAENARLTTDKIRAHLLRTAEETHRRELVEADVIKDWRERQRLCEFADNAHSARLIRIEELAASFAEIEGRGKATSVFSEMTRIVAEQGVDEAIAYVAEQRPSIMKVVQARRKQNRADLQPLLQTAGLYEAKGKAAEARSLYTDILEVEPDWPEALHAAFWFHAGQGDIARVRTTLADARRDYEEAHRMAQRLTAGDPSNTEWQRDLSVSYNRLGDVAVAQGQLEEAARSYGEALAIAKKLAAGDPSNTAWQRDVWVSYWRLADLAERQNKAEAKGYWKQAFDVLSGIEKRGFHLSPEDRKYLKILRQKAGATPR